MAITKLQPNAIPTNTDFTITLADGSVVTNDIADANITTAKIADANVTHAKLHTDMDLSSKTVTLPDLNQTLIVDRSSSNGTPIVDLYTNKGQGEFSKLRFYNQAYSSTPMATISAQTPTENVYGRLDFKVNNANVDEIVMSMFEGKVGIGTTSPTNKFEVDGGSAETRLRVSTTGTDRYEAGIILSNSSKTAFNDGVQITHGGGYTDFRDLAGTTIQTFDVTNTRIGIGEENPQFKLHVKNSGDGVVAFENNGSSYAGVQIKTTNDVGDGNTAGYLYTYNSSQFLGGIKFVKSDSNSGKIVFRQQVNGTNTDVAEIVDSSIVARQGNNSTGALKQLTAGAVDLFPTLGKYLGYIGSGQTASIASLVGNTASVKNDTGVYYVMLRGATTALGIYMVTIGTAVDIYDGGIIVTDQFNNRGTNQVASGFSAADHLFVTVTTIMRSNGNCYGTCHTVDMDQYGLITTGGAYPGCHIWAIHLHGGNKGSKTLWEA